jgi:TonB family protein
MNARTKLVVIVIVSSALGLVACGTPPSEEIDAAKAAVDRAAAEAGEFAADSVAAARKAKTALDEELKVQEGKLMKSYDRAKELASSAKAAGEKALADAKVGKDRAEAAAAKARAAAEARAKAAANRVRVAGAIKPPTKIKNVQPVYPAIARSAGVAGTVQLEVEIGEDGKVTDARVVKSVPLLDQAALDAVKQWEYTPMMKGGVAVPVVMNVTVNFTRQ